MYCSSQTDRFEGEIERLKQVNLVTVFHAQQARKQIELTIGERINHIWHNWLQASITGYYQVIYCVFQKVGIYIRK